jgi:acid phosphatase (class A)
MRRAPTAAIAFAAALLGACTTIPPVSSPDTKETPTGYLPVSVLIEGAALVPPPPAAGTPAQAADDAAYRDSRRHKDTPRWEQAGRDAESRFPQAVDPFACTLDVAIGEQSTPRLYRLMRRTLIDAGLAGYHAKSRFDRRRPFAAADDAICTPEFATRLKADRSYPSSNAATGWAWALELSELAPERADALLRRGYEYGQSRLVCGAHWQTDVESGRLVGAAIVARLHALPEFQADVAAAREEIAAARARGSKPSVDCAAEARALGH